MKKALVIGIDNYLHHPLTGCVNDAAEVASIIETHGDGSKNFDVYRLLSDEVSVTNSILSEHINKLFSRDQKHVLLYFAGHGIINPDTNAGYIVSQNGTKGSWGISLPEIIGLANGAYPRINATTIILDSCHSGFAGEVTALGPTAISAIGPGVTILAACHRSETADEVNGHGVFTNLLLNALRGGASDLTGHITPGGIYAYIDQALGEWDQRPVFKTNVSRSLPLRKIDPVVPLNILREIPKYFPKPEQEYKLDPSFEDTNSVTVEHKVIEPYANDENVSIFKNLQKLQSVGLVIPVDTEFMYFAAMESKSCKLSSLGCHYWRLANEKRI